MQDPLPGAVVALAAIAFAAGTCSAAATSSTLECRTEPNGQDSVIVSCALPDISARYNFVARWSGGHDDTIASLTTRLDTRPLPCDVGSKLHLTGEDGDVSLACRFATAPSAAAARQFQVTIKWTHAHFLGFELLPE